MRLYKCFSYSGGIWGVAIGRFYLTLKAPWNRPLWSERNRRSVRVLPIAKGWRLNLRVEPIP